MSDFHEAQFDQSTLLKLELFRGYIREWLPVFLSKKTFPEIHIYDFFCGPGRDGAGNPGSPLVILEELEAYLNHPATPSVDGIRVFLHFNDIDKEKVNCLKGTIGARKPSSRFGVEFTALDFQVAFEQAKPSIQHRDTANLLILDQYGFKEITERVFQQIVQCGTTDMLFFISSSFIRRFALEEGTQKYFPLSPGEVAEVSHKDIHRFVCNNLYRKLIPEGCQYHISPFSIEKDRGSNIYGVIFGSGNLLGLQKFLKVCWDKDQVTGEANYNIDDDIIRDGQIALLPEDRVARKLDKFKRDIVEFIRIHSPDNHEVYEFSLENGFPPKRTNEVLREIQEGGVLVVGDLVNEKAARKGSFYVSWKDLKEPPHARFSIQEASHGSE